MQLDEYIQAFRFHPIRPETTVPKEVVTFLAEFPSLRLMIENWNMETPHDWREIRTQLEEVARMPRLSSLAMGYLINEIVYRMPEDQAYVNVGTWYGYSLCAGMIKNDNKICIGVDDFSQFGSPEEACKANFLKFRCGVGHRFHSIDFREYFKAHTLPIGFYFYDAEHSYENQLAALEIAEPFFADDAIIMVDDTNWLEPRKATNDFMKRRPGQYELITKVWTANDGHPTWWNGMILFKKKARVPREPLI